MKFAAISDTHFGDPNGTLVIKNQAGNYVKGPKYDDFKKAAGTKNDYLILLGDIFDFSIIEYEEVYSAAKAFFLQIQKDDIAREMIYVPGNHDSSVWHIVEHQVNIINKIKKHQPAEKFRQSVPGIIDDRKNSSHKGFTLYGVTTQPKTSKSKYGGLYMDEITKPEGNITYFNFAHPNLYIVTDNESVLMTHGHFFETYWSLASEWLPKIVGGDLKIGGEMDVREMVGINFPLTQLACTGIGQAGVLTPLIRKIQRSVKDGDLAKLRKYADRLDDEVDKLLKYPFYKHYLEWITDAISNSMKKMIIEKLERFEDTRFNEEFIHNEKVRERVRKFYAATMVEIDEINQKENYNLKPPAKIIFGHTHQPLTFDDPKPARLPYNHAGNHLDVLLYNTGGWLWKLDRNGGKTLCGAAVFSYETGKGFKSVKIT